MLLCDFPTNLTDERTCTEGIGKLSTADGKAFADPEVLRRLTSSVSCALDEAAAALTRMRAENNHNNGQVDKYVLTPPGSPAMECNFISNSVNFVVSA